MRAGWWKYILDLDLLFISLFAAYVWSIKYTNDLITLGQIWAVMI